MSVYELTNNLFALEGPDALQYVLKPFFQFKKFKCRKSYEENYPARATYI